MESLAGFVLIGGKSSRMGEDKSALVLNGETFVEIAAGTLRQVGIVELAAVSRSETSALAGGLRLIKDIFTDRGALGGIHSALVHSKSEWTLILACDYPFVTVDLIRFLMKSAESARDSDAIAPVQSDGRIQPLCAVYRTETCRKILSKMLENSSESYSVRDFLRRINTRYIEFAEIADFPSSEHFFFNINTPDDFGQAKLLKTRVRQMTVEDIETVLNIQRIGNLSPWSFDDYTDEIGRRNSFSVVAVLNDRIVGFLVGRLIAEDYCAELYNIGVEANFRRRKIGGKLLDSFIKKCAENNLEKIFLEVRESNQTAIDFYTLNDFRVSGKRKKFYSNPTENAILMTKELEKE